MARNVAPARIYGKSLVRKRLTWPSIGHRRRTVRFENRLYANGRAPATTANNTLEFTDEDETLINESRMIRT